MKEGKVTGVGRGHFKSLQLGKISPKFPKPGSEKGKLLGHMYGDL